MSILSAGVSVTMNLIFIVVSVYTLLPRGLNTRVNRPVIVIHGLSALCKAIPIYKVLSC